MKTTPRPLMRVYATPLPWFARIEYSWRPVVGSWNVHNVLPVAGSSDTMVRRGPETVISMPST